MEITIAQLSAILGGTFEGDGSVSINNVSKIQEGQPGSVTFLSNLKYEQYIYSTEASVVIVDKDFYPKEPLAVAIIRVEDAYSSLGVLLKEYQKMLRPQKKGVEKPSFIAESAAYGENCYIGAFSYIGENVQIGDNCQIYPNVFVGDNVKIGEGTVLYAGAKVYSHTQIGKSCVLHSGVVVGSDGFGFAPQKDGSYQPVPQIGNVILEDFVEIGANTVVDRATMGSTLIEEGVKLDNLVQIAHNVKVGKHTVIAAQTGVSGSTEVGAYTMMGGQVGTAGHIKIASRSQIAGQTGVTRSITKEGQAWMGTPLQPHKDFMRSSVYIHKLPALVKRLEELEKIIASDKAS